MILSLFAFILPQVLFATNYKTPPEVLYPQQYTTWIRKHENSRLGYIDIPFYNKEEQTDDNVHLYRLDLVGKSDYERGYAHGSLLAKEIVEFVDIQLSKYYMSFFLNIDLRFFFKLIIY